ncbi:THUMP domain-containing class I SAM-dependent RNA methyltransferase [Robertkochia aurantiaca]|uniref:THUMP domain-containing class I SAM-dependent RNA methyltransferase n=1 Tax=Robertkochia aurantiaca TaxID=2873700 RepID=UPI001CCFEEFB|nr:THUMP domain-containing protein [Robertkochia sp. 3YJGBD-33]
MANNFQMLAKTMHGFEGVLADELRKMGAIDVKEGKRSVLFKGDEGFMYKANLGLRTALKILRPIASFKVKNEEGLYRQVNNISWEDYLGVNGTLAVDTTVYSDNFTHSKFVALKTKDAVVDRYRDLFGKRPDVDVKHPDLRIHVHINRDYCTISLDSSGNSLHHRGYRSATNIAPINEVMAAGMLLLSGWDGKSDFMDPMCGSGTVLVEAAMIACNIPPNINRREFGFEKWKDYDADLFETIFESLLKKSREFSYKILGYDKAPSAVSKCRENIKNANLSEFITVEQRDFFETEKETKGPLHMVFNPPYGERLRLEAEAFYSSIGDTLKQGYPGTEAWFISSNMEALKHVGLRPSRKITLYNGKLESKFLKYEIYEGSKKNKNNQ